MPKVTVLMPLYNGKTFIRESLESVQRQTFTDWEFIIVNDFGSDDGCADIVREYAAKDPRIILVQLEERLGLAASLNVGLDMAKGEYVARVDVDDPSEPERFAKQVAYMDAHPEVSLCSCYCRTLLQNGSNLEKSPDEPEALRAAMLFPNEIRHFAAMLRKEYFDAHGLRYDPQYIVEDYELWTRALMTGARFANIPEVLVTHRWGFGNISISKGERLEMEARELSQRIIRSIGVNVDEYPSVFFSGWRARPEQYARKDIPGFLRQGCRLLQEILAKNEQSGYCDPEAMRKIVSQRWDWIRQSCGLKFRTREFGEFKDIRTTPVVSVVLPTYNSADDISQAVNSIQEQTFTDWELLVVNDLDSDDGTAEIVQMYAMDDPRIRLVQAEDRLGLAESLNLGMREARGKYIARMDADDTSMPERFAKQVAYLEEHPEVGICGAWQHHFGKNKDWTHEAAPEPAVQRCRLLFWCDLCHSTLMLRRDVFIENQLFYSPDAQAEDFELWTRAMEHMQIANIPEVLGEYKEGTGVTSEKFNQLVEESGRITARTLERVLGMYVPVYDARLFNGWANPIPKDGEGRTDSLARLKALLEEIYRQNEEKEFFDPKCLVQTLAAKWFWCIENRDWKTTDYSHVDSIEAALADQYVQTEEGNIAVIGATKNSPAVNKPQGNPLKRAAKRILRRPANILRRIVKSLFRGCLEELKQEMDRDIREWTGKRLKQTDKLVEKWTWERYRRTERMNQNILSKIDTKIWRAEKVARQNSELLARLNYIDYRVPYKTDEKIRIVFVFQVASFWPSIDTFYQAVLSDDRFEVRLVCYDEDVDVTIKTTTAREYLINAGMDFIPYEYFDLDAFNPHIVVLQTPYDTNRSRRYKTLDLKSKGYRVVYIPYGLEIGATEHSIKDQFSGTVMENCWRMYTLSEGMKEYFNSNRSATVPVQVVGLPKFDALYHAERFHLSEEIVTRARGRKIVLWKVHFPKVIKENNEKILITPYINEYIAFAKKLDNYKEFFFIFMPHPRFKEFNDDEAIRSQLEHLLYLLKGKDNVYIDTEDDYRNSLVNANYIIVDRSAVMVEAGCVGVPVLYMHNPDYNEPLTKAILPLAESYYQGTSCKDMERFLEMCSRGDDPKEQIRKQAFAKCVPYFDGKCGERIKEDIFRALEHERQEDIRGIFATQSARLGDAIAQSESRTLEAYEEQFARIDKQIERWTWDRYKRTKRDLMKVLIEIDPEMMRMLVEESSTYDTDFYLDNRYGSIRSASRVLRTLFSVVPHESIADFGCGTGTWLWTAQELGAQKVLGIDGAYVPESMRLIPADRFVEADLESPVKLEERFDIAISMEVAEHLSPAAAEGFVGSLCAASDVVLFSAAHPGQGGDGHINEQPLAYWEEKFAANQYRLIDIRPLFHGDQNIEWWYRDNMVLFVRDGKYEQIAEQVKTLGNVDAESN